jgi:glycosyltransferase involved in cell wall biosynthesis
MDDSGPLRILHVSEVHWGGVVSLIDPFLEQQREAGNEVHLLAPMGPASWTGPWFEAWSLKRSRPATFVPALRQLRRVVKEFRPDVIHLHSFYAGLLGRLPLGLSWHGRVPVVYQPHAWSTSLYKGRYPLLAWVVGAVERSAIRRTDVLVANCQDELDHGVTLGVHGQGHVVGVTVDLQAFRPVANADQRRMSKESLGLGPQRLVLVLGRIAFQKGQDLLVKEWERTPVPGALLALVGPGDPNEVAELAPTQWGHSIRAFGSSDDVRAWLQAADILVLPSRYETVGLVVAEAMATGLPVVATAVDGTRATVTDGDLPESGAIVSLGDMRTLLQEVQRRLDHGELWQRESVAARVRAEAMFRPETVAARLETAYREAISARRSEMAS